MSNESNLSPHDQLSTTEGMVATMAMAEAAKGVSGWQRKLMNVFILIAAGATLLGAIANLAMSGSIPDCDAQQTRDTLSDLNFQNKFNASKYNFIKKVSASDSETKCTANLALRGGGSVEYDYRIFKDGGTVKVEITDVRR